jgi:2'-5' RNA ligase
VKSNIFLAALPNHETKMAIAQKINLLEAKRSPLIKMNWVHPQDLHITIGYIENVEEASLRSIAQGFMEVAKTAPFLAKVEEIRLYGNAVVLRVEPNQLLGSLHKKMNQKLLEVSNERYSFLMHKRYDAHITLGRIRNIQSLNAAHKQQLIGLLEEQFRHNSFLIQQAGLLRRTSEKAVPAYQVIQQYLLMK